MRALTLSRVSLSTPGDLVDRQLLDIAQQDHLAIMLGQRLDGAGKIDANVFGRADAPGAPPPRRPESSGIPTDIAQQAKAGAPRDREQPRRERRHRPQRSDAPVAAAAAFPGPRRRYRPPGNCARHSAGHQAGRRQSATTRRLLVAAARGLDQPGVAAPGSGQVTSWRRKSSTGHGAHRAKSEKPGQSRSPAPAPAIR